MQSKAGQADLRMNVEDKGKNMLNCILSCHIKGDENDISKLAAPTRSSSKLAYGARLQRRHRL